MKILFIADQHYSLKKKGVKTAWLRNRIQEFHLEINNILTKENPDIIILGGDLFDKSPSIGEVGLFLDFLHITKQHKIPVYMIAGNHEATTKYDTFLQELKTEESDLFKLMLGQDEIYFKEHDVIINFVSYSEIKRNSDINKMSSKCAAKKIAISHIRGPLPPHIEEEYPISNFNSYDLVLLGDLHYYHKALSGENAWYPGSPYSITFSQAAETNNYGIFLIDTSKESWEIPRLISLDLPQLITIRCSPSEIEGVKSRIKDSKHCYKIEVEGTPEEVSKIKDKDIIKKSIIASEATLDLYNKTKEEELELVLDYMKIEDKSSIMRIFNEITRITYR